MMKLSKRDSEFISKIRGVVHEYITSNEGRMLSDVGNSIDVVLHICTEVVARSICLLTDDPDKQFDLISTLTQALRSQVEDNNQRPMPQAMRQVLDIILTGQLPSGEGTPEERTETLVKEIHELMEVEKSAR
jgi:hypothetical protein